MSGKIDELIKQHHAFYEVLPYYIIQYNGTPSTAKSIQAGFDIDVYGIKPSHEQHPGRDYILGYRALQELVEKMLPTVADSCSVEVISFPSSVVLDPRRQFQEEGMLRIRVMHKNLQPAGEPEQRAVEELKQRLHDLGLSQM